MADPQRLRNPLTPPHPPSPPSPPAAERNSQSPLAPPEPPDPVDVLGIPIHPLGVEQLVALLIHWGEAAGGEAVGSEAGAAPRRIYNVNVHAMNLAAADGDFRAALQKADLVFCDGFGVKWGAAILGRRLPERMTPPDWIDRFAAAAAAAGQSVYALGDEPGIAEQFQAALAAAHPGYRPAGAHHGFFEKDGPANDTVIAAINASAATHLLVGFGMPLQERWLEANASRLNVRNLIPVGALFRWYTGTEQRAAPWMTNHGLEWLDRLLRHPLRHFRRYAVGNPRFLGRIFWELLRNGRQR